MLYDDLSGDRFPIVLAANEISYLDVDSWRDLTYVSGVSNIPPSGGEGDIWFGDNTIAFTVVSDITAGGFEFTQNTFGTGTTDGTHWRSSGTVAL